MAAELADAGLRLPISEGALHGFPALRDLEGHPRADAEFTQIPEGDRLRVKLVYDFGGGHRVEENTVVRQRPALVQELWSWEETDAGALRRRYRVDFATGQASAEKPENGETKRWEDRVKIEPGRTFAGFAFTLALECLRDQLVRGETAELRAVAFTPHPRTVTVRVAFGGVDRLAMGGREVPGEQFLIHPEIPAIAKPFVRAPDTRIWLIAAPPRGFLRWEGPLAEPSDEIVRVDLLPGERSGGG